MAVRWGIIGCGDVCEVKSGPAFSKAPGSDLVAVTRRNAELAADFARRHGVPKWYDDAAKLIGDPDVDAVYVATPPGSHCEYALQVAAAGKPAYVEKPMARNGAECRRMVDAFREAGVPLFVAYYRRALPRFAKVKQLVEGGGLGTITGVRYEYEEPIREDLASGGELPWRLRAEHSGGGLFFDLGSHVLDLVDHLLGPLEDVAGHAANVASPHDVEDRVVTSFRCGRVSGTASWNFAGFEERDDLAITGTDGTLACSVFGPAPVRFRTRSGEEAFEIPHPPHVHQPLVETVVAELAGKGACPSTGESATRTAEVMDLVTASYYGSRADGFWNDPPQWPGRRRTG